MNDVAGVIRIFGGNFAPVGYLTCDGTTYKISDYPDLFSVIKTTYGGDGITNFRVPDLRGDILIGAGQGTGLTNRVLGQGGGVGNVTLTASQIPTHSHSFNVSAAAATSNSPSTGALANMNYINGRDTLNVSAYGSAAPSEMAAPVSLWPTNTTTEAHNNLMPFTVFNFIICSGN